MASQNSKSEAGQDSGKAAAPAKPSLASIFKKTGKGEPADSKSKRGIKNPWIYAGTVVILAITIVAFVVAPAIGGGASQGSAPSFGSWDGKPIAYSQGSYFATQVARINEYLRQQGMDDRNFQFYAYQVWRMAFESAAVREGVVSTVKRSGFRVSEKGIDAAIVKNEAFLDNGQFSPEKYKAASLATKLSLRDSTRADLTVSRFYEDLYTLAPSTAETAFVASMAKPRRTVSFVAFPLESYKDADLATWGAANAALFGKAGISRITVSSSQSDAEKILKQVKENKLSFEDAAKSHSKDAFADKGGDAGTVFFHQFAADFKEKAVAEKIFTLKKGEMSDVVKLGEKSWAFFRINAEASKADFAQDDVKTEAKDYLYTTERGTLEGWAIAKATEFASAASASGASGFDAAARKAGYSAKKAGPFTVSSGNPSFAAYGQSIPLFEQPDTSKTPEMAQASSDEAFLTQAFSLKKDGVSKPLVLGDNVVVFRVLDDAEASDENLALVNFAFPYFQQQTVDGSIRNAFITSKRLKDQFQENFFKIFQSPSTQASSSQTTEAATSTTVAK